MSQYSTGTVSTTSGSNVVTGSGTDWAVELTAGDEIFINADVVPFVIASVDSATQITLSANYHTTRASVSYLVVRDFTSNLGLPLMNQGDLQAADIFSRAMRELDDKMAGVEAEELFNLDGGNSVTGFKFTRTPTPMIIFYIDGTPVWQLP
jgi:hypothetical protein